MSEERGIISGYLHEALNCQDLHRRVNDTVIFLRRRSQKFDAIAFRGMSGALVAPAVATRLGKNLLMVRKPTDNDHSSMPVEGFNKSPQRYVIIDDFLSTGGTIEAIQTAVASMKHGHKHKCIGAVFYAWIDRYDLKTKGLECGLGNLPLWKTGLRNNR